MINNKEYFCYYKLFLLIILILPLNQDWWTEGKVYAQTYPFEEWDSLTIEKANTAKNIKFLTNEEKNVIFYTNLARMNGFLFAKTYLQRHLDSTRTSNNKWVISLKKDLKKLKSQEPFVPMKDLYGVAKDHAVAMGKRGKTGHFNFRGRTMYIAKKYMEIAENCSYGYKDGLSIVIDLLIDEGIPDYGHRKEILNPDMIYIGVSIQPHKKYVYNCVMEFGGKLLKNK